MANQRRIRVLRVIPQPHPAGTPNGLKRAVDRLDPARFEVKVVGLYWWGAVGESLRAQGIKTMFLNAQPHPNGFTAIQPLIRLMREFRPDIVHTHLDAGNTAGTIAARLARTPILVTNVQNAKPNRGRSVCLIDYLLAPLSARIVTISYRAATLHLEQITRPLRKGLRVDHNPPIPVPQNGADSDPHLLCHDQLRKMTGWRIPTERYYTVYAVAPVDEFPFRQAKTACGFLGFDGDPIIGNVARLTQQKGQVYLLQAFKRVLERYPTARLLMVGDGPLRKQLLRETQRLGIVQRVTFTGKRPDVLRILRCLDVSVMSSLWEGCGTATLETMAAGVPIVASAVGGMSETIIPDVTGLLAPPADVEALAGAIVDVIRNPEAAAGRARAARRRVERFFSAEAAAARTSALYEELFAIKRGRR